MSFCRVGFKFILCLLGILAASQTTGALNPEKICELAVENNMEVVALQAELDAQTQFAKSRNSLSGPEVEFEHLWASGHETKWTLGVTQNFDWPGLYSLRKKIVESGKLEASLRIQALKQKIGYEALCLATQICYKQRRIDALRHIADELEETERSVNAAYESELVTILDKKKIAIETINVRIELDNIAAQQSELITRLEEMTGVTLTDKDVDWVKTAPLPKLEDYDFYARQLKENNYELEAARAALSNAQLALREADMTSLPGFGIGYRHEKEDNRHFNGFALSLTLPTWGIKASKRAAQMQSVAADAKVAQLTRTAEARLMSEYKRAVSLRQNLADANNNGLDGSYSTLLRETLDGGEITVLDYLREQTWLRQATLSILDLEEQYALLLVSLNRFN